MSAASYIYYGENISYSYFVFHLLMLLLPNNCNSKFSAMKETSSLSATGSILKAASMMCLAKQRACLNVSVKSSQLSTFSETFPYSLEFIVEWVNGVIVSLWARFSFH